MSDSDSSAARRQQVPKLSIEQGPAPEEHADEVREDPARPAIGAEAVGFIKGLGSSAWVYAQSHRYTVLYGFVGFVLAALILVIGLWATIVIAVFTGVGAVLGQIRDGDNGIVNFFRRLFGGKR